MGDDLEGGAGGSVSISETEYSALRDQVAKLGASVRKGRRAANDLSSMIDVLRKVVMVGTIVVVIMLAAVVP